ncbi:unnamed protein product [Protopolystoma xenopodis]|uniref:Uncharacterized protein n=1 Tax=Protopolystoma xenopodis TaxID=117903 RepID=A0A448WNJ6_9PLAT|nr:unnamed protein product [Protopolystoma xenopodis]
MAPDAILHEKLSIDELPFTSHEPTHIAETGVITDTKEVSNINDKSKRHDRGQNLENTPKRAKFEELLDNAKNQDDRKGPYQDEHETRLYVPIDKFTCAEVPKLICADNMTTQSKISYKYAVKRNRSRKKIFPPNTDNLSSAYSQELENRVDSNLLNESSDIEWTQFRGTYGRNKIIRMKPGPAEKIHHITLGNTSCRTRNVDSGVSDAVGHEDTKRDSEEELGIRVSDLDHPVIIHCLQVFLLKGH